jgi:hypothetical protein
MGNLKPIGSEKLTGQDKINRILEIARFNEVSPSKLNESSNSKSDYSVVLADNNQYHIVKEKQGYIIKRAISESEIDYIDPMKNRKYYSSYSQAFKRLNLMAGELNRLNENDQGVSLFGEQKKFVLKTPKPQQQEPAVPSEPPAVPSPELPVPDASAEQDMPLPDAGSEEMPLPDAGSEEMGTEDGMDDAPDMGDDDAGSEQVSFKSIQKITGKLTQKIRSFEETNDMSSEDIKYVINMILSSLNLSKLTEEDIEDIMSKFEGDDDMDMGDEDMDMGDEELDMGDEEMGDESLPEPEESVESKYGGSILDSIFSESKVDKVLMKYFEPSKKEINESKKINESRLIERKTEVKKLMKDVVKLSESIEQELASQKFLEKNRNFVFVGKTNKRNLVFESASGQVKISPEGNIL